MIDSLDKNRFQPWVFTFPSGLPLSVSAQVLQASLKETSSSFDAKKIIIVAHSVGGLVARRYMLESAQNNEKPTVQLFVSLSTPWLGNDGADSAVKFAPTVLPVWRDLQPGSAFLSDLFSISLPKQIENHMLFGFHRDGGPTASNDGEISVRSMLRMEAQTEATEIVGYDTTHTKILSDEVVLRKLNKILSEWDVHQVRRQ